MPTHVIYKLGPFKIPRVKGERYVRVYLPDEQSERPAPVLYMFDGQNIFHDAPSYAGGWHLHQAVSDLAAAGKPAPVIVGIDHGGEHRIHELSPFRTKHSRGHAPLLVRWIVRDLAPRIGREFRVRGDVAGTAIGGSSMGGLAALWAHFHFPETFGAALVMSPSLWFAGKKIYGDIAAQSKPWTTRIYVDAGGREGHMLADAERLVHQLRGQGYSDDELCWRPDPRGKHNERYWRRRAPAALEFLFSGRVGHARSHAA